MLLCVLCCGPPDTAYVRVFISVVNDNKPVLVQRLYQVAVDEKADVGLVMVTVRYQVAVDEKADVGLAMVTVRYQVAVDEKADVGLAMVTVRYQVAVDEKADVGLVMVTVSANDRPGRRYAWQRANDKLCYQITEGNAAGMFDIEPEVGGVFLAQPLDYERQKRFRLLVLVSDGRWEDYTAVVVNVVNRNDEAPVFSMSEYYCSITEDLDGSPVLVSVSGVSEGHRPRRLLLFHPWAGRRVPLCDQQNDGEMYTQRTMNREERAVMATDEGGEGLTGITDVTVNIWDINDSAPAFPCSPDACLPQGTFVMEMTAVDAADAAVGQDAIVTYPLHGELAHDGRRGPVRRGHWHHLGGRGGADRLDRRPTGTCLWMEARGIENVSCKLLRQRVIFIFVI
ncbi:hypothetical protein NHX12_002952 [Muraenolepis orangiensis]|uniref:Cadherin domain-containing protein n=1 Tax=Muraenolepis orangiensis TaxID=630683 RepID=A0A9Q0IDJ8_9TELE|nr:hypothetical protein NHX12_002952 [Muraenolepis orangiensis]